MNELIVPADFVELLKESLDRGQEVIFTPSGTSMLPMLNGKTDKVTLSKKCGRLEQYDVAFYLRRDTQQPVLHRMIGFAEDGGYIFCGDHQYAYEYGVGEEDVLALMTSFTHNGKNHPVTEPSYRRYIRRMMVKKRCRRFVGRIYHWIIKR